jgi:hypothetical protein
MDMGMPTATEHHKKLEALAGNWVGEEKMFPSPWDPKGGMAVGKINARIDIDGFYLISDYTQERGGQITFRGHGVYGYNPETKLYSMWWFDSMGGGFGEVPTGAWEGNKLAFSHVTPMGRNRYTYIVEKDGRHTFTMETSQDGTQWNMLMEGRYTRK